MEEIIDEQLFLLVNIVIDRTKCSIILVTDDLNMVCYGLCSRPHILDKGLNIIVDIKKSE